MTGLYSPGQEEIPYFNLPPFFSNMKNALTEYENDLNSNTNQLRTTFENSYNKIIVEDYKTMGFLKEYFKKIY
jgi:hypothetical protein